MIKAGVEIGALRKYSVLSITFFYHSHVSMNRRAKEHFQSCFRKTIKIIEAVLYF